MIFRDMLESRARVLPGAPPSAAPAWLVSLFGGGGAGASGIEVTEDVALTYSAVYAAFRILGESVGALPLKVYRRAGRARELARQHWAYPLLHDAPNRDMTSVVWRELGMTHLLGWGNAYSEIEWRGNGSAAGLWPIHPSAVSVRRLVTGEVVYDVKPDPATDRLARSQPFTLAAEDVLHVPALGWNGLVGLSPIRLAREGIGLGLATERFGAAWFGNGSRPGGILSSPASLDKKARTTIREAWEETHQGANRASRVAVLGGGLTWTATTIPPEDAQFLETRKFQVSEVARIFRLPPHMLADLERATFSNIEHQGLEFVQHSLRPWLVRWEQELARKLFNTSGTSALYAEFSVDGLLRGDKKSRDESHALGRQWGWLSANDVRELEGMNPIDGGDSYFTPLNMVATGGAGPAEPAKPAADVPAVSSKSADAALLAAAAKMTEAAYSRFARREAKALGRLLAAAERSGAGWDREAFLRSAAGFYDESGTVLVSELEALRAAFGAAWGETRPAEEAADYVAASVEQLEARAASLEPLAALGRLLEDWTTTRPAVAARRFLPAEEVA